MGLVGEEHFALKREGLGKGTFPLNESKAADEDHFALKRGSLVKDLSAERIEGS